jgi:hypothetical protein
MGKYDALFVEAPAGPAKGKYAALFNEPQSASMPKVEGPSRIESVAASVIPGGQLYEASKNPNATWTDKLGAGSGDLLNAALYAGTAGTAPIIKQAALNAGGGFLAPELGRLAQAGSEGGGALFKKTAAPLTDLIPENSQSEILQNIKRFPETSGEIVGSALPQAVLAMLGKGMQKVSSKPIAMSPEALKLESLGGQTTAAQSLVPGMAKKVLGGYETTMARTNPLLANKFEGIDAANADAVAGAARKSFGADILDADSAATTGKGLKGTLENISTKRSAEYQPAADALKSAKGYTKFGKDIVAAAIKAGDMEGVLPDVADMWARHADRLSKANTPKQIDLEFRNLRHRFDKEYAGLKQADASVYGDAQRSFAILEGAAKDAYYNGLNKIQDGLGDLVREKKGDYRETSEGMKPLTKALAAKGMEKPEAVGPAVLQSGSGALEGLVGEMDAATKAGFQKNMARTLLEGAKGEKGISAKKLSSGLLKNRSAIDEGLGNQAQLLQELQALAETAGQNDIGLANSSNSFNQGMKAANYTGAGAALLSPPILAGMLGKLGLDLGYTYGGKPALAAARIGLDAVPKLAPSVLQAINMTPQQSAEKARRFSRVGQ